MKVLLISENTLKQDGLLNQNLDGCSLQMAIQTAQEQSLQPTLGSKLYRRILSDVEHNSLTEDYQLLLDEYITPFLEYQVISDLQIPISFKTRNTGVSQANQEGISYPTMREIQYLVEYYANKAQFYNQRLYGFLCDNKNKYKEFKEKDSCHDIRSTKDYYNTSIVL